MGVTPDIFDQAIENWKTEQTLPWNQLKYDLVRAHLLRHFGSASGRVLDAGGGNGLDSVPLAQMGFEVEIIDSSAAMLAEAERYAIAAGVRDRVHLRHASLDDVAVCAEDSFDLALCHNVLQYLPPERVPGVVAGLARLLRRGGLLSLLSLNRYSNPYKIAFFEGDLDKARAELDARMVHVYLFDALVPCYTAQEADELLRQAGLVVEADYGIRCLCDYWGTNEQKMDPAVFARLARLEAALAERHPYKLLARFFQVLARKP